MRSIKFGEMAEAYSRGRRINPVGAPEENFREVRRVPSPGRKVCTVTDSEWGTRE